MKIRFFGRSAAQAEAVQSWWRRNRPSAPRLFADELASMLQLLAAAPDLGTPYELHAKLGVRRLLLPRTRYYIYYAYDRENALLGVLAIWSCLRGRPPSLRFFKGFSQPETNR